MASKYQKMTRDLEAMTGEARLFLLTTWWSEIPEALQVCTLALIRVMQGELGKLQSETPDSA